jgi:hypothetical protein
MVQCQWCEGRQSERIRLQPLTRPAHRAILKPWFGGKSKVAKVALVWERFGDVAELCRAVLRIGAVLLGRHRRTGIETVNDLDCMVANFWRALQHDPDAVADAAIGR